MLFRSYGLDPAQPSDGNIPEGSHDTVICPRHLLKHDKALSGFYKDSPTARTQMVFRLSLEWNIVSAASRSR